MSFLRIQVEKRLSVKEDEKRLSKDAARAVFRGGYLGTTKVLSVETVRNHSSRSQEAFPYKVKITRGYKDGTKKFAGDSIMNDERVYRDPTDIVEELSAPQALARASRVEKVAGNIKAGMAAAALLVGSSAGLVAALIDGGEGAPRPNVPAATSSPSSTVEACANVVEGTETLVPIRPSQVGVAQHLGASVCTIGQVNYQIVG